MVKIIAIGGGGFTHNKDPELDLFCLTQVSSEPRIGFVGTASGDDPIKIKRFYDRFRELTRSQSHLPRTANAAKAASWVKGLDILYIGGGNSALLLDHWNKSGIAQVMRDAASSNVVMAGVSAGAMCWFDRALSNSNSDRLRGIKGLGVVSGSCCTHYSTEPDRPSAFRDQIACHVLPSGIAIDDGVAVVLTPSGPVDIHSARTGANAYKVSSDGANGWVENPLGIL